MPELWADLARLPEPQQPWRWALSQNPALREMLAQKSLRGIELCSQARV
jgi:hypothetical protein